VLPETVGKETTVHLLELQQYQRFFMLRSGRDDLFPLFYIRHPLNPISIIVSIGDFFFHEIISLLLEY
jgi:hypothetical protein